MAQTSKWLAGLDVVATLAVLVTMGVIIWPKVRPTPVVKSPLLGREIMIEGAATKGDPAAAVAIIEYSDFECPFCAKSAMELGPTIDQAYVATGKVLRVFKHLPLFKIHKSALLAARATECARDDGKFWSLHERLFANQDKLAQPSFVEQSGRGLGLGDSWVACANSADHAVVAAQLKEAEELGITSTPTFLVGRRTANRVMVSAVIPGVGPVKEFNQAINEALTVR